MARKRKLRTGDRVRLRGTPDLGTITAEFSEGVRTFRSYFDVHWDGAPWPTEMIPETDLEPAEADIVTRLGDLVR